jgi:hypothetical protein
LYQVGKSEPLETSVWRFRLENLRSKTSEPSIRITPIFFEFLLEDFSLILAVKKITKANNNKKNHNSDRTHIFVLLLGKRGKVPICNRL